MTEPNSARRLAIIGVLVLALFGGLLTRLWFLQVTGGEQLAVAAQAQRDKFITDPALRGTIYDRNGTPLAQTFPVASLVVNRQQLSSAERAKLQTNLGALLGIDAAAVDELIDNTNYEPFESVPVAKDIDGAKATYVSEHRSEFPEVEVSRTAERRYLHGATAAGVLGYIGPINSDELKSHAGEGYLPRDTIGKTGVEAMFESELRGAPGKKKVEVDNQGRADGEVQVKAPEAGHDVRLTLDLGVQQIAEQSLQQGMDGARSLIDPIMGNYFEADAGAVVVLDARTGELVSLVSEPGFNPNDFISGDSDKYFSDPNEPLNNRALLGYAPGSTFKTFTSIALMQNSGPGQLFEAGAATSIGDYPDGCFRFGNDEKACNAGGAVLGTVDLPGALTVSSDVYFYSVGNDFWNAYRQEGRNATGSNSPNAGDLVPDAQHPVGNAIQHVARTYGFSEPTGLGLGGAEGRIPDHEFRVAYNPDDEALQLWQRGDNTNLAVGQGDVLVTPLQLANAYAAFANGGNLLQPRLAREVTQSSVGLPPGQLGQPITSFAPLVKRATGLTPEVRAPIAAGLAGVVDPNGRGTAAGAFNGYEGMPVIGKTGTAERQPKQDTAWFAAITNPDSADPAVPQYVVVAMVEQGGFGASVAAPIVRRIIDYLNNPNVEPAPVVVAPVGGQD